MTPCRAHQVRRPGPVRCLSCLRSGQLAPLGTACSRFLLAGSPSSRRMRAAHIHGRRSTLSRRPESSRLCRLELRRHGISRTTGWTSSGEVRPFPCHPLFAWLGAGRITGVSREAPGVTGRALLSAIQRRLAQEPVGAGSGRVWLRRRGGGTPRARRNELGWLRTRSSLLSRVVPPSYSARARRGSRLALDSSLMRPCRG